MTVQPGAVLCTMHVWCNQVMVMVLPGHPVVVVLAWQSMHVGSPLHVLWHQRRSCLAICSIPTCQRHTNTTPGVCVSEWYGTPQPLNNVKPQPACAARHTVQSVAGQHCCSFRIICMVKTRAAGLVVVRGSTSRCCGACLTVFCFTLEGHGGCADMQ